MNILESHINPNCRIDESVTVIQPCNLYDCDLAEGVRVGPFVEIGGAKIGARSVISSHSYVCPSVEIGEDCLIAHGVFFTNDIFVDRPTYKNMEELRGGFQPRPTKVGNRVRIGSCAVILCVTIGDDAIIGAGAVVSEDVPPGCTVMGNPARIRRIPSHPT